MQALEVPEILRLIGQFLDYPRLAAATVVCKSWNRIFTPFLYHTIERLSHCRNVPSSAVLEGYVDHVRAIKVYSIFWIPSLARCTHLKELHIGLYFEEEDHDIESPWMPLTDLVHHNPKLVTVCVTKPKNEFLRAVLTCCPQLKRLEFDRAELTDMVTDVNLIFNVCLRLEELKMVNMTLDLKTHGISWDNWPVFPTIKKLWIGITQDSHRSPLQAQGQHEFIQRCPNLESLTMSFCGDTLPVREIKDLLSPKTSPCPKIKAFAIRLTGYNPSFSEGQLVEILNGCKSNLTSFENSCDYFKDLSCQALVSNLASTLTHLRLEKCEFSSSVSAMKIISSSPHLVHFHCAKPLNAREILGIQRDTSEPPAYPRASHAQQSNQPSRNQPLAKSIHPPEWACKNLQTLEIGICGLYSGTPEWQQAVLKQLAKLTQLRVLDVQAGADATLKTGSRDGLAFRLASGLDILSSLTMLETLRFGTIWQEMEEQEIEWIIKAWPRLSSIHGWVHHSQNRRIELKTLFKKHGIAVGYDYGFDTVLKGDDKDGSRTGSIDIDYEQYYGKYEQYSDEYDQYDIEHYYELMEAEFENALWGDRTPPY
ncbi:MAG: hypothetical protein J3Q66DRAFT_397141 [Benniella sp.]|nr:MAG: hypothetical protein J3Q66DRAFT_397141 [Benniella sp.]